jgi:hypothetical protein
LAVRARCVYAAPHTKKTLPLSLCRAASLLFCEDAQDVVVPEEEEPEVVGGVCARCGGLSALASAKRKNAAAADDDA